MQPSFFFVLHYYLIHAKILFIALLFFVSDRKVSGSGNRGPQANGKGSREKRADV